MVRIALLILVGCGASRAPKSVDCTKPLRHAAQLSACEGQVVTLRGRASQTKQPAILGVDVDVDYALTDGPILEARGTLQRYTVEAKRSRPGLEIATKSPGRYWSLLDNGKLATAKRQ